jgi:hypothetical protein
MFISAFEVFHLIGHHLMYSGMRLTPLNLWIFKIFSIKKISIFLTGSGFEPSVFTGFPVQ